MLTDDELDQACAVLIEHERLIPWLYCDLRGFATVGVGDKVSATSVLTMPFVHLLDSSAADAEAKQTAFARVLGHFAKGLTADAYRACSDLRLDPAFCRRRLVYRLKSEFVPAIEKHCPQFASFPLQVKLVLIDICYNVGTAGFADFTHLIFDCNSRQFAKGADEVHTARDGEAADDVTTWGTRNRWRRSTMLSAVSR